MKSASEIFLQLRIIHFYIEGTNEKYRNCVFLRITHKRYNFTKIKFFTRNNPEFSQFPFSGEKLLNKSFE